MALPESKHETDAVDDLLEAAARKRKSFERLLRSFEDGQRILITDLATALRIDPVVAHILAGEAVGIQIHGVMLEVTHRDVLSRDEQKMECARRLQQVAKIGQPTSMTQYIEAAQALSGPECSKGAWLLAYWQCVSSGQIYVARPNRRRG